MPTKKFALRDGGPDEIEVSWRGVWKDVTVKHQEQVLGTLSGTKEMKAGREFPLRDGSVLGVKLHQGIGGAELQLSRDGQPLPGSSADPRERVKLAAGIVFFVAALNLLLGLAAVVFRIDLLAEIGIGIGSIVTGVIYLGLGVGVRRASTVALVLAIALFAIDGLASVAMAVAAGGNPPTGAIVARIFFLVPMVRALGATKAARALNQAA